jgi:hypothetical protein
MEFNNLYNSIYNIYSNLINNKYYITNKYFNKYNDDIILSLINLLNVFIENSINIKDNISKQNYSNIIFNLQIFNNKINNVISKIKKFDNKIKLFYEITKELFKLISSLTGCNLYISNINIPEITINELYYLINSIHPVLHIIRLNHNCFLLELKFDEHAINLSKNFNNTYIFDDGTDNKYNNIIDTINFQYIQSYIINKVNIYSQEEQQNITYYRNIYNNLLYPMDILTCHCELKRLEYVKTDGLLII